MSRARVAVLLSGGIDSAATLCFYAKRRDDVRAVFVDHAQRPRASEWKAAQSIAIARRVGIDRVRLGFSLPSARGEFFGRNALLVLAAAATQAQLPMVIALGVHAGCPYYDTTQRFLKDMQSLLDGYGSGAVTIAAPFLDSTKEEIVRFARKHRVPLRLTYSCERKNAPPCGKCLSCLDRRGAHVD